MTPDQATELSRLASRWAMARCRRALVSHGCGARSETEESVHVRERDANKAFHEYLRQFVKEQ